MRRLRVAAKDEGAGTDCRNRVKINKARIEKTIPYSPLRLTPSSRLDRVEGYGEGVGLSAVRSLDKKLCHELSCSKATYRSDKDG